MTPIEHVASSVVALVSAHSILVTQELHAGIDLARSLVSEGHEERAAWPLTAEQQQRIRTAHDTLQTRYQRLNELARIFA